jgi:predicted dehydrogenase
VTAAGEQPSVAVLGAGSIGLRHLQNLRALGVEKLACFEPDAARREAAAQELPIPFLATLEVVWDFRPTAIIVAAPTQFHHPLALAAVEHGAHLFVEKPLAHSAEGLSALIDQAEERGLVTMVACNLRFHPGPAAVRRLLKSNTVGKVLSARLQTSSYLPRWRPAQDYRQSYSASPEWGGAILDCIHEIDLALWFFGGGDLLAAAVAPATSLGLATDGLAELLIRHRSGVLSSLHLNFVQHDYRRGCQIAGTRGTIYWDFQEHRVRTFDGAGQPGPHFDEPAGWEINQMYLDEMAHFLACVRAGQSTMNPLRSGAETLALALAARDPKWRIENQ